MFEHHSKPLLSKRAFIQRQLRFMIYASLIIGVSLGIGMLGYYLLAQLDWVDSFFNASMILTGMGPAAPMPSDGAKIFSGCYALFSGVIFLTSAAVLFAPVAHRLLHLMHLDVD